jgi:hypothetical protein
MATRRNYQPTLRVLLGSVSRYTTRNQARIQAGMTAPQVAAFLAFISCMIDLIAALGTTPVED